MADDRTEALDGEQLAHLARYFEEEEEVISDKNYKLSWAKVPRSATGWRPKNALGA